MEAKDPNKFAKIVFTIVASAIANGIVLCLMLGLPLPQFSSSRDLETLMSQKMPELKTAEPTPIQEPVAPEVVKPKPKKIRPVAKAAPKAEPIKAEPATPSTTVVNVSFEDKDGGEKTTVTSATEEPKVETVRTPKQQKLNPTPDKFAGVQADDSEDSQTEATADVNPNPADGESTDAAVDNSENQ